MCKHKKSFTSTPAPMSILIGGTLIGLLIFSAVFLVLSDTIFLSASHMKALTAVKDIWNIFFFAGSIFTLYFAYKKLLEPFHTEIFKKQLSLFEEILEVFSKDEDELQTSFDYSNMKLMSTAFLFDQYKNGYLRFPGTINDVSKQATYSRQPTKAIPPPQIPTKYEVFFTQNREQYLLVERTEENWENHDYIYILLSKQTKDIEDKVRQFTYSPLVPRSLKVLLDDFLALHDSNMTALHRGLIELSEEMPSGTASGLRLKISEDSSSLAHAILLGDKIWQYSPLSPIASQIVSFIRNYYRVDQMFQ